jgi:hypothetical protein
VHYGGLCTIWSIRLVVIATNIKNNVQFFGLVNVDMVHFVTSRDEHEKSTPKNAFLKSLYNIFVSYLPRNK